ncbi:MAG: gamma-glutamyl-gamma-aminobutyrate hydrolase family protein [Armatimonadota bacterium]|nr:gamma-glutamyl-gamma-aminobutyrate hydrolase family protein [Armatimonadota bacterium]
MSRSTYRPRILVTGRKVPPGADPATQKRLAASARYYTEAVWAAGGHPLLAAAGDPLPDAFDGVLLSGGADVHPRRYGEAIDDAVRATLTIDDARDELEIPLARRALADDLPMLCICRGLQVINVAAGGTLWQDLSLAGGDPGAHNQDGRLESWACGHQVVVGAGSQLAEMMGEGPVGVNTFHHQAIRRPAPGFEVTAWAPDGIIEGLESRRHRFVVGVQWHPERLVTHHAEHRALFARLVEAARRA